jgi:LmbE family N-acetylglucosaminyl deacetylase
VNRRLLLVLAHPDDESMGNGTLIVRAARMGARVHLVCATRGGAGWHDRPAGRRRDELPDIRNQELAAAAEVLGLAGVELWDYPDGGVAQCDQSEIAGRIGEAVERVDPAVVVGWGPDGGYGHPDHIAIGACTDRVLAGTGRPHYHMALDKGTAEAYRAAIRAQGLDAGGMQVVGVEQVDAVLEPTSAELDTVERAIACHDSQRNAMTDAFLRDRSLLFWMARNCYVRVWSPAGGVIAEMLPELQ